MEMSGQREKRKDRKNRKEFFFYFKTIPARVSCVFKKMEKTIERFSNTFFLPLSCFFLFLSKMFLLLLGNSTDTGNNRTWHFFHLQLLTLLKKCLLAHRILSRNNRPGDTPATGQSKLSCWETLDSFSFVCVCDPESVVTPLTEYFLIRPRQFSWFLKFSLKIEASNRIWSPNQLISERVWTFKKMMIIPI